MTTYYVDNSSAAASNKNAGTSKDKPFSSLDAVNKLALKPGDVVAIKAGTSYTSSVDYQGALVIKSSGTTDKPITFTSYGTGEKPIINNTSTVYSNAVEVKGASNIVIEGLHFGQAHLAGVKIDANSSHVTVKNSEASNVGEGFLVQGSYNLITQNSIHDLHMVKNTVKSFNSDDDYGANGAVISGSNNELSFNHIVNAKAGSYDYGKDGGAFELAGTVSNIKIHGNIVENSVGFIEAGGSGAGSVITNVSITNNVSVNNGTFSVIHNGGGNFGATFVNVDVSHNTIVEAKADMAVVYLDAPTTKAAFSFHDNVVSITAGDSVFKQKGDYHSDNVFDLKSPATHLYNNWGMTLGSGEVYGDPAFKDVANKDFTATSAPEKNYGASVTLASLEPEKPVADTHKPVVVVTAQTALAGSKIAADKLFKYSDAENNAATKYQFFDATKNVKSGSFVLDGVVQKANGIFEVTAEQLNHLVFKVGTVADNIQVRAYDGTNWSSWTQWGANNIFVTDTNKPTVVVFTQTALAGSEIAAGKLFKYSDAETSVAIKYQFFDATKSTQSGSFVLDGVVQKANSIFEVTAAQLDHLVFKVGTINDNIQVRAFDGTNWSSWTQWGKDNIFVADKIQGGVGNDVLYGDDGYDFLIGGFGKDILTGGKGADVFVYQNPLDGGDRITDFNSAEGDKIQFSSAVFGLDEADKAVQFSIDHFLANGPSLLYNKDTATLSYDSDGSSGAAAAVTIASFDHGVVLNANDIIFG